MKLQARCGKVTGLFLSLWVTASFLAGAAVTNEPLVGDGRWFEVPCRQQAIVLDGRLDEPAWQDALTFTGFRWNRDDFPLAVSENTILRITYDETNLYLGWTCYKENMAALTARAPANGCHDLKDDRLEIYFDGLASDAAPYQLIIVNSKGIFRGLRFGRELIRDGWYPRFATAAGTTSNAWCLEMRLPLAELGRSGLAGELCRLNVERMHPYQGSTKLLTAPAGDASASKFLNLVFAPPGGMARDRVVSLSRGALSLGGLMTGENRAEFQVDNASGRSQRLRFEVVNLVSNAVAATTSQRATILEPRHWVGLYYPVLGKEGEQVRFAVWDEETTQALYAVTYDVAVVHPFNRVYRTPDPLFEPLLDRSKTKDPRLTGSEMWNQPIWMTWPAHNIFHKVRTYGVAYSLDDVHRDVKNAGYHFLTGANLADLKTVPSVWKSADPGDGNLRQMAGDVQSNGWSTLILYAPYTVTGVTPEGKPGPNIKTGFGFTFDPVNARAFVDSSEMVVRRYGSNLWAVFVGDEQYMQNYLKLMELFKAEGAGFETNAFLKSVADDVKATFGGGRYGIPQALDEKDPAHHFGHGALIRWIQGRLRPVNREFKARIKAVAPDMPVLSEDCMAGLGEDVASFSDYADVAGLQLTSPFFTRKQRWMCRVKLVKDLSGLDYVLPCPHEAIDGLYDGACNPEEIVELYSQLVRGGATGINAYPASWGGGVDPIPTAQSCLIGYPTAWQMMLALTKQIHDLPPLKFPKADSAIYFSENSSVYYQDQRYPHWAWLDRYDDLFTHLGVEARGWFKFVSDNTLKDGKDKLEDYRVVYVPDLKYSEPELVKRLVRYVEQGGTLVCLDPDALAFDLMGNSLEEGRKELFGVSLSGKITARTATFTQLGAEARSLPVLETDLNELQGTDGQTRVVATFDNGKPALVEKTIGRGKAFFFAYLPINEATLTHPDWTRFWTDWHRQLGCSVGNDIWRFKLPMPSGIAPAVQASPTNYCLTGNFGFWQQYHFYAGDARFNLPLEGVYTIRVGKGEAGMPVVVGDGRLTDRLKATTYPKTLDACGLKSPGYPEAWIEIFTNPAPIEIVFTFARAVVPEQLKLYYNGELNGLEVTISSNGRTWEAIGALKQPRPSRAVEVKELVLDVNPGKQLAKAVKITIPARTLPQSILTLAELEIWGDCPALTRIAGQLRSTYEWADDFEAVSPRNAQGRVSFPDWNYNNRKGDGQLVSEKAAHQGRYALRLAGQAEGKYFDVICNRRIPICNGARISLRFWVKGKGILRVSGACYDAERRYRVSAKSEDMTVDTESWISRDVILAIPADAAPRLESMLLCMEAKTGSAILVDALTLKAEYPEPLMIKKD